MPVPGFSIAEYQAASSLIAANQAVNVIPEPGQDGLAFRGVPGTVAYGDLTDIRGEHTAWEGSTNETLYVVAGAWLYEVRDGGHTVALGSVGNDGLPVSMAHNIFELACFSGGSGYTVQKGTQTFAAITDTDVPEVSRVQFLDGYGLLLEKNSGRFHYTAVNDFESLDGVDFATAEGAPDDNVSMIVDHREIWLFGAASTEVWFNSVDATNPFQRQTFVEQGCRGVHSPAKIDNTVFWLGEDGSVYRAEQYNPVRISHHGIEHLIKQTTTDPIGFAYGDDGHAFYQLNFPGELSITYDAATNLWHRRKTRGLEDCAYRHHAFAYGKHWVGGEKLYTLEDNVYTHDGELERIQAFGPFRTQGRYASMAALTALFETGEHSDSLNPQKVFLEISDDAGKTYGPRIEVSIGTQGDYTTEVKWLALGGFYDAQRVVKLTMTDNARYTLLDVA